MRASVLILLTAALATPACKKLEPRAVKEAKAERAANDDKRIRQACASQASYERLKALAFEKAREVRTGDPALLDKLAATTVVRMEEPVVKSRDEGLNVTVCKGKMVIDLPPGAEDAFNGERRLVADVEYAAQSAADGSGLVYQLDGAEPIIYRLAAIGLKGGAQVAEPAPIATRTPEAPAPLQVAERAQPLPEPRATPSQRAAPQRPAPPQRAAMTRPSFNCRYARTRTEQMVCADEGLAARDRDMASLYYQAIANTDPETRAILRGTRDRFLAQRERCGGPGCVAAVYEDRMDEIDRIVSGE